MSDDTVVLADATKLANPEEALNPRARRAMTPATSVAFRQDPGRGLGVVLVAAAAEQRPSWPADGRPWVWRLLDHTASTTTTSTTTTTTTIYIKVGDPN